MNDTNDRGTHEQDIPRILQNTQAQREDLKVVDIHIEKLSRRVLLGSVFAYVVFASLCITAAYLWVDIATGQQASRRDAIERKLGVTEKELGALKKQMEENRTAARERSEKLAVFFEWFIEGKYEKILKEGRKLSDMASTPLERLVVQHVTTAAKRQTSFDAYAEGVHAYNAGKPKAAIGHLTRAMKYDNTGPHIPALRYYLGLTHYKQSNYRKATIHLEAMLKSDKKQKFLDDHALFRLGHSHELLKQNNQAKRHYKNLLKSFPKSQYVGIVRSKINQL